MHGSPECMVMLWWFDLVSLMLTSADVILSKVSEKDEALEMAKLISAKITQQPSDKPALALKDLGKGVFQILSKCIYIGVKPRIRKLSLIVEFVKAPDLFQGLVHEDCITKMRLISLGDLGSDESGRIPYKSYQRYNFRLDWFTFLVLKVFLSRLG
ncbi:hypothetical protein GBA52_028822 [Prunus armeniaca]|nr:hypothetical protein GBA52_028822 [Prunus armeniaca]